MPTISWFYGIAIRVYFRDHPPPHFHAVYGEHEAIVSMESGEVIGGALPRSASKLVNDWATRHRSALLENWERARRNEPLERIPGLDAD